MYIETVETATDALRRRDRDLQPDRARASAAPDEQRTANASTGTAQQLRSDQVLTLTPGTWSTNASYPTTVTDTWLECSTEPVAATIPVPVPTRRPSRSLRPTSQPATRSRSRRPRATAAATPDLVLIRRRRRPLPAVPVKPARAGGPDRDHVAGPDADGADRDLEQQPELVHLPVGRVHHNLHRDLRTNQRDDGDSDDSPFRRHDRGTW